MIDKKIRVLHILDELNTGGAERIVVSYFQNIDRNRFKWDFIITKYEDVNKRGLLEETVERLGGRIYRVTRKRENYKKNIIETARIIKNGNYDIVHSHLDELSTFYLMSAKKEGVPVRICHSHLAGADRGKGVELLCKCLKPFLRFVVSDKFACGKAAGKALWGKKAVDNCEVYIMTNAIDITKFSFNKSIRNRLREELGIDEKFVLGTVGRLSYQKNSPFLIKIMAEILKKRKNSILLVVGEGDQREEMEKLVDHYNLKQNVLFLGSRQDVNEIMMAMDVFVLPSRFEGLPIVLVEAQCSGLSCIISDRVTNEIKINHNVAYIPFSADAGFWAEQCVTIEQEKDRQNLIDNIKKSGYEITTAAKKLENYYCSALKRSASRKYVKNNL